MGSSAVETEGKHYQEMPFDEMGFTFAVNKGQILVDELRVASPEIALTGRGFIDFAGALSMASRFYISDRIYHAIQALESRLPAQYAFGFRQHDSSERYFRDYLVRNSVADPTFNLWEAAPGDVRVRELRKIFSVLMQEAAQGTGARKPGDPGEGAAPGESGAAND